MTSQSTLCPHSIVQCGTRATASKSQDSGEVSSELTDSVAPVTLETNARIFSTLTTIVCTEPVSTLVPQTTVMLQPPCGQNGH